MTTETELTLSPPQPGEPPQRQLAPFDSFKAQVEKLKATAEALTVTDAGQLAEMKLARQTRLQLKEIRCAVEGRRKELVSDGKKALAKIDSDAKAIKDWCEAQEARLLDCELFTEREQTRLEDERRTTRTAEIGPFINGVIAWDLGRMTNEEYAQVLADSKELHALRLERERKDKETAEAFAKMEQHRIEAQRIENERLKAEAAKAADILNAVADQAARARKADREAAEAVARVEREARQKVEADLAAHKAEVERLAAEQRKAEQAAAAAPDREKLMAFARMIRELQVPLLPSAPVLVGQITDQLDKFAAWVTKKADAL